MGGRPRPSRLLPASVVLLALAGCQGTTKREVAALAATVDAFRGADAATRAARARAVVDVACADEQVCDAKRACVAAIDPTSRALGLKDEVEQRLGDIQAKRLPPDAPEAQALPAKLDEAERLLREGRAGMDLCERKLSELRVYHGV